MQRWTQPIICYFTDVASLVRAVNLYGTVEKWHKLIQTKKVVVLVRAAHTRRLSLINFWCYWKIKRWYYRFQIIYAWARDAPRLDLPKDVGFKVGKNSPIKYLVLQVHYAHVDQFRDGSTDDSGVFIHYTTEPMSKLAGVLLLGTSGVIPPMKKEYMETSCEINEKKTIYPFAYRTHTHSLGKVVSGYRVRPDENGNDEWTLLGKRDPLTPQMFYPVVNTEPIKYGDRVAARCTMISNRQRVTKIG